MHTRTIPGGSQLKLGRQQVLQPKLSESLRAPQLLRHQSQAPSVQTHALDQLRPIPQAEADRKFARTVYDHSQWQKHRSPLRLLDRLLKIGDSKMLKNVVPTLLWVASVSSAIAGYTHFHKAGILPAGWPALAANAACKAFITNTTMALSLLLVFRTNASYSRWDEARKLWGMLVNRSRDLMRQAVALFPDHATDAKQAMARWLCSFPRLLRCFVQPEVTIESELSAILKPAEIELLKASANPTVKGIHALSEITHKAVREPTNQLQMSTNLTAYHDVLGGCERLLRAPIPVSYTRHTARFLFCWVTLLPFALDIVGPTAVAVTVGITAVLAIIEEIGVQCEEPFGVLPLEVICNRIQTDVMNTLKDDDTTKAVLRDCAGLAALANEPALVFSNQQQKEPAVVYAN